MHCNSATVTAWSCREIIKRHPATHPVNSRCDGRHACETDKACLHCKGSWSITWRSSQHRLRPTQQPQPHGIRHAACSGYECCQVVRSVCGTAVTSMAKNHQYACNLACKVVREQFGELAEVRMCRHATSEKQACRKHDHRHVQAAMTNALQY